MRPALSILTPQCFATEAFTNATAAVARLDEIYERNTGFLRDRFGAYANGEAISPRVRATYPFVRITTIAQTPKLLGGRVPIASATFWPARAELSQRRNRQRCAGSCYRSTVPPLAVGPN